MTPQTFIAQWRPAKLDVRRKLFTDPEALRPGITSEAITVEAAKRFGDLADAMRQKGVEGPWAAGERILVLVAGMAIGAKPSSILLQFLIEAVLGLKNRGR